MKVYITILPMVLFTAYTIAQPAMAKVQFKHNSADTMHSSLDIRVGDSTMVNDLAFRSAAAFIPIPAGAQRLAINISDYSAGFYLL